MSRRAEAIAERTSDDARLARRRTRRHRWGPWSRRAHLLRLVRREPVIPADRMVSPAARLIIESDVVIEFGCDHMLVFEALPSGIGPQADVLILHGTDYNEGDVRTVVRAIQVRDLEVLIEEGDIDIAFGPNARDYNRSKGWGRNGSPTLASLGTDPWR